MICLFRDSEAEPTVAHKLELAVAKGLNNQRFTSAAKAILTLLQDL